MPIADFERFEINLTLDDAAYGAHPGNCDQEIADLLEAEAITTQFDAISDEDIRAELAEYGAWDSAELADATENRARILWIACGNILAEAKNA